MSSSDAPRTFGPRWYLGALLLGVVLALPIALARWSAIDPVADGQLSALTTPHAPQHGVSGGPTRTSDEARSALIGGHPEHSPHTDTLMVEVLDTNQHPVAGLTVIVAPQENYSELGEGEYAKRKTDPAGRATFPGWRSRAKASPHYLVHDVCFERRPSLRLTATVLAAPVVQSVQPDFGSIRLIARDSIGNPAESNGRAALALVLSTEADDPGVAHQRPRWEGELVEGEARFKFVELGRQWVATASRAGASVASTARGHGPRVHRARAEIEIALGRGHPIAVFRAVDPQGSAITNTRLEAVVLRSLGREDRPEVRTNAGGEFEIDCRRVMLAGHDHVRLTCRPRADGAVVSAAATLPSSMSQGRNHLGDLVFRPSEIIARGRAFDSRGRPVAGLTVRAGMSAFHLGMGDDLLGMRRHSLEAKTDRSGRFELVGPFPAQAFMVWADGTRLRSEEVDAKRGARNIALQCFTICNPVVHLQLPPGAKANAVDLLLGETESEGGDGPAHIARSGDQVVARMSPVSQGIYDLSWGYRGQTLGKKRGIRIEADERIAAIDLRDDLQGFSLTLVPPTGGESPSIRGFLLWRPARSEFSWRRIDIDTNRISFLAATPAIDVRICAAGYQEELRTAISRPETIRLRPGIRVRFVLRTDGKLPGPPYEFRPMPSVERHEVGIPEGSPNFTEKKRSVVFTLPSGSIKVRWSLAKRTDDGMIRGTVLNGHEILVKVEAGRAEQSFELDLDGEAIREMMDRVPW